MEGYAVTGERGCAQKIGTGKGKTFDDAVRDYMNRTPGHLIEPYTRESFISDEAYENRRSNWKIWGCALFDNETDARKAFG
jgi:hypothetical protein